MGGAGEGLGLTGAGVKPEKEHRKKENGLVKMLTDKIIPGSPHLAIAIHGSINSSNKYSDKPFTT